MSESFSPAPGPPVRSPQAPRSGAVLAKAGRRRVRLWSLLFALVVAVSTLAGALFASPSMAWPGSQQACAAVAVTVAVNQPPEQTCDLLGYGITAGHSHGPPTSVDAHFSREHTYYVLAGTIPVLVHNTGETCDLAPYGGPGGGHHVPAKAAFRGAGNYDIDSAPDIPTSDMERLGLSHSAISGAQAAAYRAFGKAGVPLTWEAMAKIESDALVTGGMDRELAVNTVQRAIDALRAAGVRGPTRIPWVG